jgi:hypothetical protein
MIIFFTFSFSLTIFNYRDVYVDSLNWLYCTVESAHSKLTHIHSYTQTPTSHPHPPPAYTS